MKKEEWQDTEQTYEILVDEMSPLTRADLQRSGLAFSGEQQETDNRQQASETSSAVSSKAGGASLGRVLIAAAVLCVAGALGIAVGFGVGGLIKPKRPQQTAVSDSSQISSQGAPQEEKEETISNEKETLTEAKFDVDKTAALKNVNFIVIDGMCDDDMLFFTLEIGCNASLIGKSTGKVADPYMNVQLLPDETKLEPDSFQILEREGSSFTARVGFRLPHALEKEQEIRMDFYGVSVSREKINPKTGFADVVCDIRQRQPSTVSFVYDGQKGDFARRFYTESRITLNDVMQDMDVAYVTPWFCQFSLYTSTDADQSKEMPEVKLFMKDGKEIAAAPEVTAAAHWEKDGASMARTTYTASFEESVDSVNVAYIEINGVKAKRTDKALRTKLPSLEAYGYDEAFGA